MCTIYILSGKVFGKNIYEVDSTSNLNDRLFFSESTGFPESNVLHYSSYVEHVDINTCQKMIINSLYKYRLKEGKNFYQINIIEAIEQIEQIVLNINNSYTYKIEQERKQKQIKKQSCF